MKIAYLFLLALLAGCGDTSSDETRELPIETTTQVPAEQPIETIKPGEAIIKILPEILTVDRNVEQITLYKKLELTLTINAQYDNHYDQREALLNAIFTAPDGSTMLVPGYWDKEWKVRFTPSQIGKWSYTLTMKDTMGTSKPNVGSFDVLSSDDPGWLQVGSQFDPTYSSRYLVHHDGTPFYGIGHGDVFSVFSRASQVERLLGSMQQAKENYFVWWPQFYFSLIRDNYDDYNLLNGDLIDSVLERTEREGLFMVFTLWDHSQLRDTSHDWSDGNWWRNGFRHLVDADSFFTDDEAWQWQENWYRYIIGRWGYSPSIAMWQTVSEINGTNAYENSNEWHQKIHQYFSDNDPYNHPTTASMAGDLNWVEGHNVMDLPQVHIYEDLQPNNSVLTINSAKVIASYTQDMWQNNNKPNWIGEFGVINNTSDDSTNYYPELFHNAIWSALGAGAALTPAEWNDFDNWGVMTAAMEQHLTYFSDFISPLPMAAWDPIQLVISSKNSTIRGWGIAGKDGGLVWVQDHTLEGLDIVSIRANRAVRKNVSVDIAGLTSGQYKIVPYNTWQGVFGESYTIDCSPMTNGLCTIALPDFTSDMAFKLERI